MHECVYASSPNACGDVTALRLTEVPGAAPVSQGHSVRACIYICTYSSCQPRPQRASRARRPLRGRRSRFVAPRQGPPALCDQVTDWTRAATRRTRLGEAMRLAGPGRGRRSCFRSCRRRALGFSASAARPAAVTALAQQRINAARWKTGRPRRADNNCARQPWWQQVGGGVARGPLVAGPEGSR